LPISIYITGQVEEDFIKKVKESFRSLKRGEIKNITKTTQCEAPKTPRYVEEKLNVNQAKLCIGFRTNINPISSDYFKLMVYNSILGGGLHSKLFQNVREKEGLAYFAFSRVERLKGLLIISCGIEISNKEKAINIINEQIEEINKGNISDYEFESSIKTIESSINAMKDSQLNMSDFMLVQNILETNETLDSVIEKIKKVTKEDVIEISKIITLDTTYFLTGI
jgi:predicted Zn-dependent peptidase